MTEQKRHLLNYTYQELEQLLIEEFDQKKFRAKQIFQWIYQHNVESIDEMTNISKNFRDKLKEEFTLEPTKISDSEKSKDGTEKLQFTLKDGSLIESVLIPADGRVTLCVSSQVGCAMGCKFCFTGSLKLKRSLECFEMVDQYRQALKRLENDESRISNVVVMGMGEPLQNLENTVKFGEILMDDLGYGLSSRRVVVSTSGIVPKIRELGQKSNVGLAVSLNATTNEIRDKIMPVNKKYPLEVLIKELEQYPAKKRKRILLEYVLLKGINDSDFDAKRLIKIAHRVSSKVNLIPFNAHDESDFVPPSEEQILKFQKTLQDNGVTTMLRQSRGEDIHGACGMLGKGEKESI